MQDRRSMIAEKVLQILEVPLAEDAVSKLRELSGIETERADIRFSYRILKFLDEGRLDEAEDKLKALKAWHEHCVGPQTG